MDVKADGLVLRSTDYGENDKMVTLLTAEHGKLSAAVKGVRKAGAKLRFACQPFCFAEYVFAGRCGRFTVTQASLHNGFYDIRNSVEAYYAAAGILEVADALAREELPAPTLLVCAVEALEAIDGGVVAPALARFLFEAASLAGYPVTAEELCPVCGRKIAGRRYFDMASGSFNCAGCAVGVPASPSTHALLRKFSGKSVPDEETEGGAVRAVRLLRTYLSYQTDCPFETLAQSADLLG